MARGSIIKRNGRYGYRADLGPDPSTGKRRQLSKQGFRTKREAETALGELLSGVLVGSVVSPKDLLLGDYLDEWMEGERQRLKVTTWESYRVAVERIRVNIGALRLQGLTPRHVKKLYTDLSRSGGKAGRSLAPKSVRNTHIVLRKALADAERLELIPRNPAAVVSPPTSDRPEQSTWSAQDVQDFFAAVAEDRLKALWILLATTGMRRGEALGLRWKDLDLDNAELRIIQTLTTARHRPIIQTPKTKRSRRVLYLDRWTVAELKKHRRRQREEQLKAGPGWHPDCDLVFRTEDGSPTHPDKITRRFRTLSKEAGLDSIRLHDLRHTYATLALKSDVHPKIVSERLGHATVGITLDLYSHVTPALGRDAADVVAEKLFG